MLKFYNLRTELIKSVLEGLDDAKIDFPFRVSPSEQRIIEMEAPTSIILVGAQLDHVHSSLFPPKMQLLFWLAGCKLAAFLPACMSDFGPLLPCRGARGMHCHESSP